MTAGDTTHTVAKRSNFAGFVSDLQGLVIGFVAFQATHQPTFALRQGALICAVLLLSKVIVVRFTRADWLAIAFALLGLFSLQWTQVEYATEVTALNYLGFGVIFLAVRAIVIDRRALLFTILGFLAGCAVVVKQLLDLSTGGVRLDFDASSTRLGLEGVNPNYLAYTLATGAAFVVLIWVSRQPALLGKLALLAVLILLYVGIVQNGTRGALIGFFATLVWVAFQHFVPGAGFRALWVLVVSLNVIIVTGVLDTAVKARLVVSDREAGDLNGRLGIWPLARDAFADHPFIGTGAGTFANLNPLGIAAHNVILDIGTSVGILGVALFAAVIYRSLVVETRDSESHTKRVLVVGSFVTATTPLLSTGYWYESPSFWIALAVVSRMSKFGLVDASPPADKQVAPAMTDL